MLEFLSLKSRSDGESWVLLVVLTQLNFCGLISSLWFLLHVNISTDFSSVGLLYRWVLAPLGLWFLQTAWIRISPCSFMYNKVQEIIEMPDKQENGGHTSQLRLVISDTAAHFESKLNTGHINFCPAIISHRSTDLLFNLSDTLPN